MYRLFGFRRGIFSFAAIAVFSALPFFSSHLTAQYRAGAFGEPAYSPAQPAVLHPEPIWWYIGLIAGANIVTHEGDFTVNVCDRQYEKADGVGIHVGAQIEHFLTLKPAGSMAVALKVLYNSYDAEASYIDRDIMTYRILDEDTNEYDSLLLDHRRLSSVKLSYLTLNPMFEFFPIGRLYIMAGPAVGLKLNAEYDCRTEVVNQDEYDYFETNRPNAPNPYDQLVDVPGAESIRLDVRAGIGYNFKMSRDVLFSPEISYIFPLNAISSDNANDWKAKAISIVAVLKIGL